MVLIWLTVGAWKAPPEGRKEGVLSSSSSQYRDKKMIYSIYSKLKITSKWIYLSLRIEIYVRSSQRRHLQRQTLYQFYLLFHWTRVEPCYCGSSRFLLYWTFCPFLREFPSFVMRCECLVFSLHTWLYLTSMWLWFIKNLSLQMFMDC